MTTTTPTIGWPITQGAFRAMTLALGARYCHSYSDRGAVFYAFDLGGNFIVYDNGGEVNIMGINRHIDTPSIPMSDTNGEPVGPSTAGYRIRCALLDDEIDYGRNIDRELAA